MASLINDAPPLSVAPKDPNTVDTADAYTSTKGALADWLAAERAKSAAMGYWNDEAGLPTQRGLINAVSQVALGTNSAGGGKVASMDNPAGAMKLTGKIPVLSKDMGHYQNNPSDLVVELKKLLGEDGDFAVGLRGPYQPEMGKPSLRNSWQSPDGDKAYRLPGTSTIGATSNWEMADGDALEGAMKTALERVKRYGDQDYISVVVGKNSPTHLANDPGENIISNAKAVAYIPRGLAGLMAGGGAAASSTDTSR